MSKLKPGTIGYVMGCCPVLILDYHDKHHYQRALYLREPKSTRKYASGRQYHSGEIYSLIAIHKQPKLERYRITAEEQAVADLKKKELGL